MSASPPLPPPSRSRSLEEFGDLRAGTLRGAPFAIARAILLVLGRLALGFRIKGVEHVPSDGPLIVVANHLHNADPLAVMVAIPRPVHFMAKRELFEVPILDRIIRLGGAFPVDRGRPDRKALRRAEATLAQDLALGMFPEGTRSTTGALKQPRAGAALLALRTGAPVLPVAVTGTERLPFNGKKGTTRRYKRGIIVTIGKPFTIAPEEDGRRVSADAASDRIMREIAALLPEEYRGVYADVTTEEGGPVGSLAESHPMPDALETTSTAH